MDWRGSPSPPPIISNFSPGHQHLLAAPTAPPFTDLLSPALGSATKGPSPVCLGNLLPLLRQYPNKQDAILLLEGFTDGFKIPYVGAQECREADNLRSARELPAVVRAKAEKERALGRVAGPFLRPPLENFIVSPLGIVPKKEPGAFRLIHHLSYPEGKSVNHGLEEGSCSVTYCTLDVALDLVRRAGKGAWLAKADIESAFRLLPVHPSSQNLLGFKLDDSYVYDRCMPMGCAISCAYFEAFSTFLQWALQGNYGVGGVSHYLDDFLFIGGEGTQECKEALGHFKELAQHLGVPLAPGKTEGPAQVLTFLGIELDTIKGESRLPADKVRDLASLIQAVVGQDKVPLGCIQKLLGKLNFAARVIPAGRVFARRLARATARVKKRHHMVKLSKGMKEDLAMWANFLTNFNGTVIWRAPWEGSPELALFSDASGREGFGVILDTEWCVQKWPNEWHRQKVTSRITVLELFPIVIAFHLWPTVLSARQVVFWSDNMAVVQAINSQSSSCPLTLCLLRELVRACLVNNVECKARHIQGVRNIAADALSRFQWRRFREAWPRARERMTPFPPQLWYLLKLKGD